MRLATRGASTCLPSIRSTAAEVRALRFSALLIDSRNVGKDGISLIVSDTAVDARRLYERRGYKEVARRKMVKEKWRIQA
jgi:ribosomal protein S18 acetylase RimI-like enzyme